MSVLKADFIKGTIWSIIGQFVTLFIVLVGNIWLARLLSPDDFGVISIVMFFITIASVFVEGGLGGALIRKKTIENVDYSTVFIFNLVVSILLYLLLIVCTQPISEYYQNARLLDIMPVAGIILVFNAFQLIQNTRFIREMKFKERAIARILAILISTAIGITLAYLGYGIWSLIILQIFNSLLNSIFITILDPKRLKLKFSKASFKELYSFGLNTTLASVINVSFDNIYQLILAKYFSITHAGYYYQAKKIQDVPGGIVNLLSQGVLFSTLSKIQDDREIYVKVYNKILSFFIVFLGLFSIIFYIYADQITIILLGEKWLNVAFYMKLLTIASFFYYIDLINRISFKVFNQTRLVLILEILKKIIQLIGIVIGIYFKSIEILLWLFIGSNIISCVLNTFVIFNKLKLNILSELKTIVIIIGVAFLSIFLHIFIIRNVEIFNHVQLLTFPIILILYFSMLKILNVFDLINLVKELKLKYFKK